MYVKLKQSRCFINMEKPFPAQIAHLNRKRTDFDVKLKYLQQYLH